MSTIRTNLEFVHDQDKFRENMSFFLEIVDKLVWDKAGTLYLYLVALFISDTN